MSKYIILDAGHAKVTGGKRSPDGTLLEWEFNNDMQYRLKAKFEKLGFIVYLVNPNPEKGSEVSLASRCSRANSYWSQKGKPECLYISLHANAAGANAWGTARGVEVYTAGNASSKSKSAAKLINDQIYKDVYAIDKGFRNRGHKTSNFYVIKHTNMPSCLIEYEFYTNKDGVNLLKNRRDILCEATVKAVCNHFNVKYANVEPSPVVNIALENDQTIATNTSAGKKGPFKNGTYNTKARVVNAASLNIRAGRPGDKGYNTIYGTYKKGEIVFVKYCLNNWFGVIYNGKQAFICGDYLELI